MYIEKLTIKKFRSINHLDIIFNKGVNIIIGENNSGKTAVIDALRICLSVGRQWRDIGIRNDEDFYIETSTVSDVFEPIEFDLFFKIEHLDDRSFFNSLVWQNPDDNSDQNLQMHFKYELEKDVKGNSKLKWNIWGGHNNPIDIKEAQLIYYSYLEPLRDAEQELKPYSNNNKISSLFKEMTKYDKIVDGENTKVNLTSDKKNELSQALEDVVKNDDWTSLIFTGQEFINEHLEKADIRKKSSKVHLKLLEYKYENIVKGLITRKPVYPNELISENPHQQKFFDISQNGLGENNLILASAVLGDLKNRREEEIEHYYALLIEEPEAHLHPQRQNTFFNYLNSLQNLGVQIFITSHSPTITAKSELDNLLILQKNHNNHTKFFSLRESSLSDKNKSYLRKFLDVTKAQLFFSNGTILVEGISEALLLPVFAKKMGEKYDLDKNGIEIVNINGVAFDSFANLYNSDDEQKRLSVFCSLITDDDRGIIKSSDFINEENKITKDDANAIFKELRKIDILDENNKINIYNPTDELTLLNYETKGDFIKEVLNNKIDKISDRAQNAKSLMKQNLRVELACNTFEYELMIASEFNAKLLLRIYKCMHPKTDFINSNDLKEKATDLLRKLKSNKDKSTFAENLAYYIDSREYIQKNFTVPKYIEDAIKWVIDKKV